MNKLGYPARDLKQAKYRFSRIYQNHQKHHDLPNAVEFERHFLRVGLDPNDGYFFGRAVDTATHQRWSRATHDVLIDGANVKVNFGEGGPFNAVWRTFFARKAQVGVRATADDITTFLETGIRSGPVEIDLLINGQRRTFEADFSDEYKFSLTLVQ